MRTKYNRSLPASLRTIFLDRDGVINEKRHEGQWVTRWEEFRILPQVPESIRELNALGLQVLVVTNQRGIALNLFTLEDLQGIHLRFTRLLEHHGARVDSFYVCPHDKGQCQCRKPLGGLFEEAKREFPELRAETSVIIGDSLSDVDFGRRLGMYTIFIQGDPETQKETSDEAAQWADVSCSSLHEAVEIIRNALIEHRGSPGRHGSSSVTSSTS